MTDLPIIFSPPMIRALLDGRKTQTRRLAWGKPIPGLYESDGGPLKPILRPTPLAKAKPGDRLWVRERLISRPMVNFVTGEPLPNYPCAAYAADNSDVVNKHEFNLIPWWTLGRGLPSIHMPRFASRLTLVVTEVRRQRLQDISEEDAIAEGAEKMLMDDDAVFYQSDSGTYQTGFAGLWLHLHGVGSWDSNPEVVALSFTVHRCNIDLMEMAA